MMSDLFSIQSFNARYVLAGMLILLLLAVFPLAAAAEHSSAVSYSGDDVYDPAAGGLRALSVVAASDVASYGPAGLAIAGGFSGDDAYDPAAGGLPALSAVAFAASQGDVVGRSAAGLAITGGFSGDGAYDPAAGGLPALSVGAASQSDVVDCDPAGSAIVGRYSGDDAYDLAAGGNPSGTPRALACLPSAIGTP
jgi:hypothetical protein